MIKKLTPQEKAEKAYKQILRMQELNRRVKEILGQHIEEETLEIKPIKDWKLMYQGVTSTSNPEVAEHIYNKFYVRLVSKDGKQYRLTVECLEEV